MIRDRWGYPKVSWDVLGRVGTCTCRTWDLCVLVRKWAGGDIPRRPGMSQDELGHVGHGTCVCLYENSQVGISRGVLGCPRMSWDM